MRFSLLFLFLIVKICSCHIFHRILSFNNKGFQPNDDKSIVYEQSTLFRHKRCKISSVTDRIRTVPSNILDIRGGKKNKVKKKEEKIVEANDNDDLFDEGNDEPSKLSGVYTSYIKDIWVKTPPISQVYLGSTLGLAVACLVLNKNQWPEYLNLEWLPVLTKLQIWRPLSAFMYFGPIGLNYILTLQFVWTYFAQLEKLHYNRPEEFLLMIAFGCVALIGSYSVLGLSTKFLGHNLSTFLVYIWSRLFEGTEVNVMDLFLLKAEILPWFFVAQTFLLEGEIPFADMLGIVVGHLYHYLSKRKIIVAPKFLKDWFASPKIKAKYARFKGEFE